MIVLLVFMVSTTQEETQKRVNMREMFPQDAEIDVAVSACCPCGLWFIIAFPLGIAAIITLKNTDNNRHKQKKAS